MGAKKAPKKGTKAATKKSTKPAGDKLTGKERLFVAAYLRENFNATKAAIAAGYSEKTAAQLGYQLMQRERVQKAIAAAKQQLLDDFGVDMARTVRELARVGYANAADIVDWDEGGNVTRWTPSGELTADQKAAIAEFSQTITLIPQKNGPPIEKRQSKFKQHPKIPALVELLKWHKEQAEGGGSGGNGKRDPGREAGDTDAFARAVLEELGEAPAGE